MVEIFYFSLLNEFVSLLDGFIKLQDVVAVYCVLFVKVKNLVTHLVQIQMALLFPLFFQKFDMFVMFVHSIQQNILGFSNFQV